MPGGTQEGMFRDAVKDVFHVNNPNRISELLGRSLDRAVMENGPTQFNIPREMFYHEHKYSIPKPGIIEKSAGGPESLKKAADLINKAERPVLLLGGGSVISGATSNAMQLAEKLNIPVCVTYLHNDAFPKNHRLMCGPLGYNGSRAAMKVMNEADLVIGLGTRMSPFGTLPQYGFDYWPKDAKLIQVDTDYKRLGLTKPTDVSICGDARRVADYLTNNVYPMDRKDQCHKIEQYRKEWSEELDKLTYDGPQVSNGRIKPRRVLAELAKAMPSNAIVSTDIGNICSSANSYLNFDQPNSFLAAMTFGNCQYAYGAAIGAKLAAPDRPCIAYVGDGAWGMSLNETLTCVREKIPVVAVVFNNEQWGAEKKNQVIWFGDRYIGSNLVNPSWAEIATAMGANGVKVDHPDQIGQVLQTAVNSDMPTVIEVMCTRELGEPFRRDAMRLPKKHLAKYQVTNLESESETGQPIDFH